MTKKECQKLCKELLDYNKGYLIREIGRLFDSGAINTENYKINDKAYTLPRILLKTALLNYADHISLVNPKKDNKHISNLRYF